MTPKPFTRVPRRAFQSVLAAHLDPLGILATTAPVVRQARHVLIDVRRIETVAHLLSLRDLAVPVWNYHYHFFDETERSVMYIFLLDALNFSFWGDPRWKISYRGETLDGYWALAAALKNAATSRPEFLAADYLAEISPHDLERILRGQNEIPLFEERWRNAQELGRVIRDQFGGRAANVVRAAEFDAARLARLVADRFSSFHDTSRFHSREVRYFKRAQILAADLWGSFGGKRYGKLTNLDALTSFADYKVPQILRAWGILHYDAALSERVDGRELLHKDSPEENEIRAAMLWSVELLRAALARYGRELTSLEMDSFLWASSQQPPAEVRPYHCVRTIYY